ncbi:MAG: UvrD-helicase domain-containing protein [Desulfamplus sp.]|nr:UvrD-helicase domain-containing protein [Desulfamplus sp.]
METKNIKLPNELIHELVNHWGRWDVYQKFYLETLAPQLVENPGTGDATEKVILYELKSQLTSTEWNNLPKLIADCRDGQLKKTEIEWKIFHEEELKEQQYKERVLKEELRRKEEQERLRQETLRKEEERNEYLRQEGLRRQKEQKRLRQEELKKEKEHKEQLRQQELKKQEEDARRRHHERLRNNLLEQLYHLLEVSFLECDDFYKTQCQNYISREDFEKIKVEFVQSWIERATNRKPDTEQAAAIASFHNNFQVVARAGSGKTTTLVNRTLFLLKHCHIAPNEILLLAFNRKASIEIRRKLLGLITNGAEFAISSEINRRRKIAGNKKNYDEIEVATVDEVAAQMNIILPHVLTFHALAYAIVHPEESLLFNGTEGEAQGLSRVFQQVIDDHMQIPEFKAEVREIMLEHFKSDWERIVLGGYDRSGVSKSPYLACSRFGPPSQSFIKCS